MFGDRTDELAVKPVRNKNRIKANVITEKWEAVIMKAFLLACVAAVIIAIIGVVVLNSVQEPVDQAFTTSAVRLGK
jgi:hypothetical protein